MTERMIQKSGEQMQENETRNFRYGGGGGGESVE